MRCTPSLVGRKLFAFIGIVISILNDAITRENNREEAHPLLGEYNHRTGRLDAGTDPNGWYEEDM